MRCAYTEFSIYEYYTEFSYENFIKFLREKDEKYENILLKPIPFLNSSHQVDWIYSLFNIEDFDNFDNFTPKKFLVISEKKETSIKLNDISIIEFIPITKEEFEKAIKDFLK